MPQIHTQLVRVFQRAVESHRHGAYEACLIHLRQFDRLLRDYLGNEEAQLEDYLGHRLAGDAVRLQTMRKARARLRQLARAVHEMLQPPRPDRINPALSPDFALGFENMARSLGSCVDTYELELLPLCRAGPVPGPPAQATKAAPPAERDIWGKAARR